MMIRQHYIGSLLLLCFSVFLAHNLVPHHHHSELISKLAGQTCPIDHEDHREPGDHATHCHAFNEVTFYKVKTSGLMEDVREITLHANAITAMDTPVSWVSKASQTVPLKISLPGKESGGSVAARAPPKSS
jgi:hypothetical protein